MKTWQWLAGPTTALCLTAAGLPTTQPSADGLSVRFQPETGSAYVELLATYLGLDSPRRERTARTWTFHPGPRGTRQAYARLFQALPTVQAVWPDPGPVATPAPWVEGELLVKLREDVPAERVKAFHTEQQTHVLSMIEAIGVARIGWNHDVTVPEMVRRYQASGLFGYVEPNKRISIPPPPGMFDHPPSQISVRLAPGADPSLLARVLGSRLVGTSSAAVATLQPRSGVNVRTLEAVLPLCPGVEEVLPAGNGVW
jgi:hypothetical protein